VKNFTNFACSAAGETLHIFADITDGRSFAGIFWAWKGLGKRKLSGAGQKMADKRRCAAWGWPGYCRRNRSIETVDGQGQSCLLRFRQYDVDRW